MRRFLGAVTLGTALILVGCNDAGTKVAGTQVKGTTAPSRAAVTTGATTEGPAAKAGVGELTPENTTIEFVGTKKDGKKHDGGFKKFSGTVTPTTGDFSAAHITLEIHTESIYTDDQRLTGHLKSQDFFEVAKHPKATFNSTKIEAAKAEGTYTITGDLTLHGKTKPVSIPAKLTQTDDAWMIEGTFKIDRLDYGIAYQPAVVDKEVTIKVSAKVARK